MVRGLEKFKEYFKEFSDNYIIIGGTACDIALTGSDMPPRATDDIDMILIVDNMTPEFGQRFWQFISDGEYQNRERKRGEGKEPVPELFRFIKPSPGYPIRIELLSTRPDILGEPTRFHLTPIPIGEKLSSLSAIVMDPDCYQFTIENSMVHDGLRVATPLCLICLKVRAFLNLTEEKKTNPEIRSQDIKKHRDDVFKLLVTSIDPANMISLPDALRNDMKAFADMMEASLPNQSLQDRLRVDNEQIVSFITLMREVFDL